MLRLAACAVYVSACLGLWVPAADAQQQYRRLPVSEYRDKMRAGWTGQFVAAAWGLPVEFRFNGEIVPESMVPKWKPWMLNDSLTNDDLFLDSALLYLMNNFGIDVPNRKAAIERASVWGPPSSRLLSGIAPPDSYNPGPGPRRPGLGFMIAGDITGLVAPGLPNTTISLGERLAFQQGDGLYGGQFVAAMYGEAFFETSPAKLIQAGLRAIPADSGFAEMVRDVVKWSHESPNDWQKAWQQVQDKYRPNPNPNRFARGRNPQSPLETWNMDVKVNGAYVVIGLLYGDRDLDKTIITAIRAGDDTDCNPGNAAGVLFTTLGYSKLPARFQGKIDENAVLHYTFGRQKGVYSYPQVLEITEKVAREAVVKAGGRIEKTASGEEVFVIPVQEPKPSRLVKDTDPIPLVNSRLTREELARLRGTGPTTDASFKEFAPGWELSGGCELGLTKEFNDKANVFVTYPPDKDTACKLTKKFLVPPGEWQTDLQLNVSHASDGAYTLIVKVNGEEVHHTNVVSPSPWTRVGVDVTPCKGKEITLEVINQPHSWWDYTWAYWGQIALESTMVLGPARELDPWGRPSRTPIIQ